MSDWLELRVTVPEDAAEAVEGIMLEEGVLGTSRVTPRPGEVLICGYMRGDSTGERIADDIQERLAGLDKSLTEGRAPAIERHVVRDEDWAEAWKAHFKPLRVGQHLIVSPTWESFKAGPGDIVIEMDPKMAFGTGSHPTTRMCLEVIEESVTPGVRMIDVGCGTGILAIAAAKLGATVTAIDSDPVAVRTCAENLALNDVEDRVSVQLEHGLDMTVQAAELIVANITAEAVAALAPAAAALLVPGGLYVCSGFSTPALVRVRDALEQAGLTITQERRDAEWLCLVTQRRARI